MLHILTSEEVIFDKTCSNMIIPRNEQDIIPGPNQLITQHPQNTSILSILCLSSGVDVCFIGCVYVVMSWRCCLLCFLCVIFSLLSDHSQWNPIVTKYILCPCVCPSHFHKNKFRYKGVLKIIVLKISSQNIFLETKNDFSIFGFFFKNV